MFTRHSSVFVTALLILSVALGAVGCKSSDSNANPAVDERGEPLPNKSKELSRLQFDDVPFPKNFTIRNRMNESYTYQSGDTRIGRLVYWGEGWEADVREMYIATMPLEPYFWKMTSGSPMENSGPLFFEKKGHRARIEFGTDEKRLVVTIHVENI